MWKQLKQLIILFLCLTSVSPRPLDIPTESSVGPSFDGNFLAGSSFDGISQYVLTDNDVDVSIIYIMLYIS